MWGACQMYRSLSFRSYDLRMIWPKTKVSLDMLRYGINWTPLTNVNTMAVHDNVMGISIGSILFNSATFGSITPQLGCQHSSRSSCSPGSQTESQPCVLLLYGDPFLYPRIHTLLQLYWDVINVVCASYAGVRLQWHAWFPQNILIPTKSILSSSIVYAISPER